MKCHSLLKVGCSFYPLVQITTALASLAILWVPIIQEHIYHMDIQNASCNFVCESYREHPPPCISRKVIGVCKWLRLLILDGHKSYFSVTLVVPAYPLPWFYVRMLSKRLLLQRERMYLHMTWVFTEAVENDNQLNLKAITRLHIHKPHNGFSVV